jgi:outer membrane protein assembly factor BamB
MSRAFILCLSLIGGLFFARGGVTARAADVPVPTLKTSAEWPQWRGPNRDGMSPDTGLSHDWDAKPPQLLWTAEGLGSGYASVTVADGRIYTTGNLDDGQAVICLNAADGKLLWTKYLTDFVPKHGYDGSRCSPSLDGDRLYAIASSGKIACLKAAGGSEIWSRDFKDWNGKMMSGWGFSESPLVDGDWVLCTPGSTQAMIVALDKHTGKEIWHTELPASDSGKKDGAAYSSIVVSNACGIKQYVQLVGRGVIGVRASDGKFLWDYTQIANRTANIPTPLVSGDYVFCSTGYQTGSALLRLVKDGGVKCEEQYFLCGDKAQNHHGQMVLKDGFVYFGHRHGQGFPICIEMLTGKIMWGGSQRGPGNGSAAICYADGNLVFRYQSGEVALIEATSSGYHLKGSFKPEYVGKNPCWAQPVVIGGRLYLRDQDKLMCYDVRQK